MKNTKTNLLEDPIAKTLFKLGGPMVLGIFFILFFILVDVFFIAQLGEDELAAVSFTIPVVSFIDAIILGFSVATTVVVSRTLGQNRERAAKKIAIHAILLALGVISSICFIGQMTITPLFKMIGAMDRLMPLIQDYMFLSFFGMMALVPPLIGNSVMRGSGNTVIPAIAMLIAALLNAILDPILIFGLLGAPKLGMNGAAIATILARLTGTCFVFYHLIYRFHLFDGVSQWYRGFKASARELLHTAIPAATANIVPPMTALVLTGFVAHYGAAAVSAYGVATRVELLFYVPFFGASAALSPFIGQNWGAQKHDRIKKAFRKMSLFNIGWGMTVACILIIFGENIIQLFSDDPQTITKAMQYFMIVPISYCAVGLIQVSASSLNAMGKPRQALLIPIVQFVGLVLPIAYIGQEFFGLIAIFVAVCLANFITAIIFYSKTYRSL